MSKRIFTPEEQRILDRAKKAGWAEGSKEYNKFYGITSNQEVQNYSMTDRAKQLSEGFAGGVGKSVDIYKKYVESPINYGVGRLAKDVGLENIGSQLQSSAQDNWDNDTRYEESFKKPFETQGNDETKELLQSVGKGIDEGVTWVGMTAATGGLNNAVNIVKMTPKGFAPLKAPWLNKINDFLQFGSQSLGKTAATFGAGRGIEKMIEKEDDSELMKFTKGLGSFVLGGITVDKLEKPLVNATKSASNTILSSADFIFNPSTAKFNALKEKIPTLKEAANSIKETSRIPRDVAYNFIVARAERAKLDQGAIKSFDELGIPKSALTIYSESYLRPNWVANHFPSGIYEDYMTTVREDYIKTITSEFEKSLGKIQKIKTEDTLPRAVAEKITNGFLEQPDLPLESQVAVNRIKHDINLKYNFTEDKNNVLNIPTKKDNDLKETLSKSNESMLKIVQDYNVIKNYKYSTRNSAISDSDTINPSLILKTAEQLRKEFDIAGSQGTSIGTVHNVSKDVEKQFRFFSQLDEYEKEQILFQSKQFEKQSKFIDQIKENIFLQEESGLQSVGPEYVFKLKETINQHVNSGFISENQKKVLTKLTRACDDTIKHGIENGTIKNPDLYKYTLEADDFYKNEYLNLVKLDIVKALQRKQTPDWLFKQLDDPEKVHQINSIISKSYGTIEQKKNSQILINNLKRLKVQDVFAKKLGYSEENTSNINPNSIYKLFNDQETSLKLKSLMSESSFERLKENSIEIGKRLEHLEKVAQNPLLKDGNNAVEMILEKIKTRKGVDELVSFINRDMGNTNNSQKLIRALKKLSGYEYLLADIYKQDPNIKGPKLYQSMSDKLRNEDLLIGIFGSKTKLNEFRKDLLNVSDKMYETYNKDARGGGFLTLQQLGSPMDNLIYRAKNEVGYAIGGYQLNGISGVVGAILGKNWIARCLANAATDEKMVQQLIKTANKQDNGLSFTKLMLQSANDIVKRTYTSQYPKVYGIEKAEKTFDEYNKDRIRRNRGVNFNPNNTIEVYGF